MFSVRLSGRGQRQDVVLRTAVSRRDLDKHRLPPGKRPGLVEDHRVDVSGALERDAVLHEEPVPGTERRRDRDDERDRETEGVRARDHEHGRGADDGTLGIAEQHPRDERGHAGDECHVEQERGRAIAECLGTRLRGLGRLDQTHDPRQRRLGADSRDADPERPAGDHRSGDRRGTWFLGDRTRLSGDQ